MVGPVTAPESTKKKQNESLFVVPESPPAFCEKAGIWPKQTALRLGPVTRCA